MRSDSLIALGSNQKSQWGDPRETVLKACENLRMAGLVIRAMSEIFRTPAFPVGSGPDFANAAIAVDWDGQAGDILGKIHDVESAMGRARKDRWGPRIIDLDLIALGQTVLPSEHVVRTWINLPPELQAQTAPQELILPHPRLQDRGFVLVPLAQIAPDWQHPILQKTVREMLEALPSYTVEEIVPYK